MIDSYLTRYAETIRDDNTGVTYEPASFDGGIGYVITHPDGRQECLILSPTTWHEINPDNGAEGDTFLYRMNAAQVAAWDAEVLPYSWSDFTDNVITYVNHFEKEPA